MKRTRRAALAMIAGSSGLLAVDTFGFSSGRAERSVDVEVVSDADAYLGLVDRDDSSDDGVETGGILFEESANSDRHPPASFEVINQLTEPITLSLAFGDDRLRFVNLDSDGHVTSDHGQRLAGTTLEPGDGTTIGIDLSLPSERSTAIDLDSITTTLEIDADGTATGVEAERTLTLVSDVRVVIDCCPPKELPDGLVVVRNRRLEGGPSLAVEWIDCTDGTSTLLREITSFPLPILRLSLFDGFSSRTGGPTARLQAAGSERASDSRGQTGPTVVPADDVTVDVDRDRTGSGSPSPMHSMTNSTGGRSDDRNGNRSGTDADTDGSSDFVVEIDPDPSTDAGASDSRRVETVDVSLDSISGGTEG